MSPPARMNDYVNLFNANDNQANINSLTPSSSTALMGSFSLPSMGTLPTLANITLPNSGSSVTPNNPGSPLSQMLMTFTEEEQMGMDADGITYEQSYAVHHGDQWDQGYAGGFSAYRRSGSLPGCPHAHGRFKTGPA